MRGIRRTVAILAGLLLLAGASFAVLKCPRYFEYPEMTVEQIADNYASFYSVVLDRSDITNGTYRLSPGKGDRVALKFSELPQIPVKEETSTKKNLSDDGGTLKVRSDTRYFVPFFLLGEAVVREVMVQIGGKEFTVPVKMTIEVRRVGEQSQDRSLREDIAKKLQNLAGGPHTVRGVFEWNHADAIKDRLLTGAHKRLKQEINHTLDEIIAQDPESTELVRKQRAGERSTPEERYQFEVLFRRALEQIGSLPLKLENFVDPNDLANEIFYLGIRFEKIDDIKL